jgi:hypothetical protein
MKSHYSSGPFQPESLAAAFDGSCQSVPPVDLYYVTSLPGMTGVGIRWGEPECCSAVIPIAVLMEIVASHGDFSKSGMPTNTASILRCIGAILNPANIQPQTAAAIVRAQQSVHARN